MKARPLLDTTFWLLVAVLLGLGFVAWQRGGPELVQEGLASGAQMLVRFGLIITVSFLAAGLAERVVPQEWVRSALGEEAGVRGIAVATAAGIVTPAGPFVSLPVAAAMLRSGASEAAVLAYVSGWALLALHRLVAWEVPILGLRFALLRYALCIALPLLVGIAARALLRI